MLIRSLLSSILLFLLVVSVSSCSNNKTAYVDMFKLVQEFELQKEYSEEAKREMDKEKSIIDSVIYVQKLTDPASYENIKAELYGAYYRKVEERNREIEKMIWKRLNPYLTDYGKEHKYSIIYGANGTGNVLYADEALNITDEVIKYINNRYHGKK